MDETKDDGVREDEIDITGVDLVKLTQEAYRLSSPRGLGFLQAQPGPLPEDEARALVEQDALNKFVALALDYVAGRAVKLVVFRRGDRLAVANAWFDHTPADLVDLLVAAGKAREDVMPRVKAWR